MNPVFTYTEKVLGPSDSDTICIYAILRQATGPDVYTNFAEISFAADTAGMDISMDDIANGKRLSPS